MGSASGSLGRNMHEWLLEANFGMGVLVAQIKEQIKRFRNQTSLLNVILTCLGNGGQHPCVVTMA